LRMHGSDLVSYGVSRDCAVNIRDRAFPVASQPARSVGIRQIWGELQTEEGPRIQVLLGIVFRSVVAGFSRIGSEPRRKQLSD
jgi:hypothetical protein